ncbi:DUF4397 domain-containing protein [Sphingobacteriales bacterium UPWRP_1]|nr:hypothetical protein B6N25_01790 [Sphingobacteriales bacterium TSM_CSS]PSJ72114.1 DUF4397 domain-containing protein [Sphingobacteriales bacterium UPWRP_1]
MTSAADKVTRLFAMVYLLMCVQCNKNNSQLPVCYIMAIHAQPNLPPLTITTNDNSIATALGYTSYSPYSEVEAGQLFLTATNTQTGLPALQLQINTLVAANYYSLLLVEEEQQLVSAVLFTDSIARTDTGKVYLRFINASPDAGETSLYAGAAPADTLFSNLELNPQQPAAMAAQPRQLNAGQWSFTLANSNPPYDTLLQIAPQTLQPGGSYTLLLLGYKQPATPEQAPLSVQFITHGL